MTEIPTRSDARPGVASAFLSVTGAVLAWAAVGVGLMLPGGGEARESEEGGVRAVEVRLEGVERGVARLGERIEALEAGLRDAPRGASESAPQ